jgi:hypothetical protein
VQALGPARRRRIVVGARPPSVQERRRIARTKLVHSLAGLLRKPAGLRPRVTRVRVRGRGEVTRADFVRVGANWELAGESGQRRHAGRAGRAQVASNERIEGDAGHGFSPPVKTWRQHKTLHPQRDWRAADSDVLCAFGGPAAISRWDVGP